MATSPRLFTDPLAGASYAANAQLSVGDLNAYLAGWRADDLAHETQIVMNWPPATWNTTVNWDGTLVVVWSPVYKRWVAAYQANGSAADPAAGYGWPHQGSLTAATTQPSANLTIKDIAVGSSDGWTSETIFLCGDPVGSSTEKYRWTANGGVTWNDGGSTHNDSVSINTVCHHLVYGILEVWVSGDESGRIETTTMTSPSIWSAQTNVNANAISSLASNGVIIVGVSSAATNKCIVSRDGVTWEQRVMATTATSWYDICWVPQQKRWVAVGMAGGAMVFNVSSDAITWSAVTVVSGLTLSFTPRRLLTTGNLLVLVTGIYVYVSNDLGVHWRIAKEFVGWNNVIAAATAVDANQTVSQILVGGPYGGTNTRWAGSLEAS